jgi:hypothetical protein
MVLQYFTKRALFSGLICMVIFGWTADHKVLQVRVSANEKSISEFQKQIDDLNSKFKRRDHSHGYAPGPEST